MDKILDWDKKHFQDVVRDKIVLNSRSMLAEFSTQKGIGMGKRELLEFIQAINHDWCYMCRDLLGYSGHIGIKGPFGDDNLRAYRMFVSDWVTDLTEACRAICIIPLTSVAFDVLLTLGMQQLVIDGD